MPYWTFGDKGLSGVTFLLSRSGNNINSCISTTILHTLLLIMSKVDKLAVKTEPVAHDNMILMLNPGYQTSLALYSMDNHI